LFGHKPRKERYGLIRPIPNFPLNNRK